MITFAKLGDYGRLGNQMFQIATVIGYAEKYGYDFRFKNFDYNKFLDKEIPIGEIEFNKVYKEPIFNYRPIPMMGGEISFEGYFQCEKYFKHCEKRIREFFTLKKSYKEKLLKKYPELKNKKTCSIHVRRGDYLKYQELHTVQNIDYYMKAVEELYGREVDDIVFVICAGGSWDDEDNEAINWCKKNFNFKKMIFAYNEYDVLDLFLMSYCDDNIIANSSFSWWSAWLNQSADKRVIAPRHWFTRRDENNLKPYKEGKSKKSVYNSYDLVPREWVRV